MAFRPIYLICFLFFTCNTQTKTEGDNPGEKRQGNNRDKKEILFKGKDFYKWTGADLTFEEVESISYDINQDGHNDSIIIERVKGWESEPGDFQQLKVLISGKQEFVLLNTEGWVRSKFLMKYDSDFKKDNLVASDYVIVKRASKNDLLLFIEGYVYASAPGFLTIINVYKNSIPTLVFNDNIELFNTKDYNQDGIMDLGATVWNGFYSDEQKNKYRFKVFLLDGGFTFSEKYSIQLSEEMNRKN